MACSTHTTTRLERCRVRLLNSTLSRLTSPVQFCPSFRVRSQLEQYIFGLRSSIKDEKIKSKLSEEDRKTVEEEVERVVEWLQRNENAELEDFENKYKEVSEVCSPIMQRVYAEGAGGPGGPGGMPDMSGMGAGGGGGGGGGGGAGPKVEEVD